MNRTPQLRARLTVESLEGRELTTSLRTVILPAPPPALQAAVVGQAGKPDQFAAGAGVSLTRHLDWVSGLSRNHNETLVRDRA